MKDRFYEEKNKEEKGVLKVWPAMNMPVGSTFFKKRAGHLVMSVVDEKLR